MFVKKANIPPNIRAKFEELGRPTIQIKYNYVAGVKRLDDQDKKDEPLGGGVTASGREMREWLAEQALRDACWRNAGVIFAVIFGLFGIAFGLRHWYCGEYRRAAGASAHCTVAAHTSSPRESAPKKLDEEAEPSAEQAEVRG